MIETPNAFQQWAMRLDRRTYAVAVGLMIGVLGGLIGTAAGGQSQAGERDQQSGADGQGGHVRAIPAR